MLEISYRELIKLDLSVGDIAAYARDRNWQQIPHKNQNLWVFEGPVDDCGHPIHLILPSRDDFGDTPLRLAEAISLLANVEDCSLDSIVNKIQNLKVEPVCADV